MPPTRCARAGVLAASIAAQACYSGTSTSQHGDDTTTHGSADDAADGDASSGESGEGPAACEPAVPRWIARLTDRHVANTAASLLGIARPTFATSPSDPERFLPDQLSAVTGAVAVKFQAMAETAAAEATTPGAPLVTCDSGDESACADAVIDELASRAFRRAATADERTGLRAVYDDGVEIGGDHAAGIRLVIEAILQAPSFIYEIEAPTTGDDRYTLSSEQLAARISFFLTDTVADTELWRAARDGNLETDDELAAQVDRILATPAGAQQLRTMFGRFFDLHRVSELTKDGVDPTLFASMRAESEALVDHVLTMPGGSLSDLLLSREASIDAPLAALYGVDAPADGQTTMLPATERAGILTRAAIMSLKSTADDSSVIHRGLLLTRNLLCQSPPPPSPESLAQGEEINGMYETERERMLARQAIGSCGGCHRLFDPLGVTFEHYDRIGAFRTEIETSAGPVAVDSAWHVELLDIDAEVADAVELSALLAESSAVHGCVTQKFAGYALGRSLGDDDVCTVSTLAEEFEATGGDLTALVRLIAVWPGLRERTGGEP